MTFAIRLHMIPIYLCDTQITGHFQKNDWIVIWQLMSKDLTCNILNPGAKFQVKYIPLVHHYCCTVLLPIYYHICLISGVFLLMMLNILMAIVIWKLFFKSNAIIECQRILCFDVKEYIFSFWNLSQPCFFTKSHPVK